ncbi:hypothetical protein CALCODRAFT_267653 [Calocera cornea HHB12733]|uniref:Uncharacterized protein n=1 Tax=Calocera cornea HHB12733 TaxID=1353952 RepID=A0A165GAY5_9BASI|nr:hypothetical protein CALCODRAFT_267653 [Calocera cornea HHB12733]
MSIGRLAPPDTPAPLPPTLNPQPGVLPPSPFPRFPFQETASTNAGTHARSQPAQHHPASAHRCRAPYRAFVRPVTACPVPGARQARDWPRSTGAPRLVHAPSPEANGAMSSPLAQAVSARLAMQQLISMPSCANARMRECETCLIHSFIDW